MDWEDYTEIAEELDELYPDTRIDALSLSKSELKKMIISLPDFNNNANEEESDFHAKFIRNEWVSIRMPKTRHENDSAYL